MKSKKEHSRIQYIMTLAGTLFALGIIVYYTFSSFYSVAMEDAISIGKNSVSQEAEELNNFLLRGLDVMQVTGLVVDSMMRDHATSEEIEKFLLQESEDYARTIDENFTGIYGVFDGVYLDGIGWTPDEDYVPQERIWYTTAYEGGGKPMVVSPYLDAQTNSIMISVSQLLSDGESVVSLDIAMDEMQEMAQNIQLNGAGYGFIIDRNGLVVAHYDESQKGKNYLTDSDLQDSDMQEMAREVISSGGEAVTMEIAGEECMIFSQVVQQDWFVVMVVNTADLFERVEGNLWRNIWISLVIFIVVGYFCTSAYYNRNKATRYAEELKNYQATLEERVEEQTKKIKEQTLERIQMQESVIEGMAAIIESRDNSTGEHVRNTKRYVSMIADYMLEHGIYPEEVDEQFTEYIRNAAPLHDVGKILISDVILNKPGKFTPEEFEIMKTHALLGEEIVEKILDNNTEPELLQMAKDVVCGHHEKWDGSGYPSGLSGEMIPLAARIMAVADVFDALVCKRVYKEAMAEEEAYTILREDSGKHFDPVIVDVFFQIRNEVHQYLVESRKRKG